MTRRAAFLFCCAVLFLVSTSAHAGARRTTPGEEPAPTLDRANLELLLTQRRDADTTVTPVEKAHRDLADAIFSAYPDCEGVTVTLDGGDVEIAGYYCRQQLLATCKELCFQAAVDAEWTCINGYDKCYKRFCDGFGQPSCDGCLPSLNFCRDQYATAWQACDNDCYNTWCYWIF